MGIEKQVQLFFRITKIRIMIKGFICIQNKIVKTSNLLIWKIDCTYKKIIQNRKKNTKILQNEHINFNKKENIILT